MAAHLAHRLARNGHARRSAVTARRRKLPPVPVRAVDFVMYCARDMWRMRSFYQRVFGLRRGGEWNQFWSEFKTAPVTLCLNGPGQKPSRDWQGPPAVALAVGDIHAAIRECRRHKVKVLLEPVETSVCWMAFIADPEGNRICLHQRKDGTAGRGQVRSPNSEIRACGSW
jgi:predicted enzyme related to lactoylglutathione lyase